MDEEVAKKKPTLAALLKTNAEGLSDARSMQLIGSIIDMAKNEHSLEGLDHALALLDAFGIDDTTDEHRCRVHYFRANIWSARRHAMLDWQAWHWKSEAIDGEILELRRALNHQGFAELNVVARAQIYTNLACVLNHVGRFVEAIEVWDRALALIPQFAMALGNRGIGLAHYADALYDGGHHGVLIENACASLAMACDEDALHDSDGNGPAVKQFQRWMHGIWDSYDIPALSEFYDPHNHSLGRGKMERDYRQWCLNRRLFINPLNDVGPHAIAGRDVLTLPTITTGSDEGPSPPAIIHHFNIIKQEFCTSRYALYEGLTSEGVHFSDRGVLLYNILDYPAVGLAVERMKMAFRSAYAIFDKIAFLLNVYFELGHNERQVNFRNLWFVKGKGKVLHPMLDGMANWPLRGLFWLSKDIFEDDFREVTEPDAQALYELRNHLEHKFVSVHDGFSRAISPFLACTPRSGIFDISTEELASKTLRQLKLARAAIIYLSLAVHAEERRRARERGSDKLLMPMALDTWEDDWKRQF